MVNSELYIVLFNISKKDLNAARLLYENEHYPQAVFSLQQSIEKAVKSIAVFVGDVKNPSSEIGHQCANYYKLSSDNFKARMDKFEKDEEKTQVLCKLMGFDDYDLSEGLQEIKKTTEELENSLNTAIKKSHKQRLMTNADMVHIISDLEEIENECNLSIADEESFFSTDEEFELYKLDMVNKIMKAADFLITKYRESGIYVVENAHEIIENEVKSFGGVDKDSWNKMIYSIIQMMYASKSLYCLSLITDAHAVSSRYPIKSFNPIEFYTSESPIIKNFDFLIDITEKVINSLSYVYEEYAKNVEFQNE